MHVENRVYGYARISSSTQHDDRQLYRLDKHGVKQEFTFVDVASGKDFDRPQWQLLKKCLRQGDILVITSIDRLGRSYEMMKDEWHDITQNIKADIMVLDTDMINTTKYKDTLGTFISDLVFQILCYFAEVERVNIKKRQREGIEARRRKNLPMGRPKIELPESWDYVYDLWVNGNITAKKAMAMTDLKRSTFYRFVKQHESKVTK